jgi:hypothetical protein
MRGEWKKGRDGREYQDYRYTPEDLRRDVLRYRTTPDNARKFLQELRHLFDRLLDPKTTDARRAAIVNLLQRRLVGGYSSMERVAILSKIASGEVDPVTYEYIER